MKKLLIWGTGAMGLTALDCALAGKRYTRIDFLETKEKDSRRIPDYMCVYREADVDLYTLFHAYDEVLAAVDDPVQRMQLYAVLHAFAVPLALLIHPSSVISPFAQIETGCIVHANTVVEAGVIIREGCILHPAVILKQNCQLEKGVTVEAGAMLGMSVFAAAGAVIETGCILLDHVRISAGMVVKAGTLAACDIVSETQHH